MTNVDQPQLFSDQIKSPGGNDPEDVSVQTQQAAENSGRLIIERAVITDDKGNVDEELTGEWRKRNYGAGVTVDTKLVPQTDQLDQANRVRVKNRRDTHSQIYDPSN